MLPSNDDVFISVKISNSDTRLFTMKAGMSFLRTISLGVPLKTDSVWDENPAYAVKFLRREEIEKKQIDKLLGLKGTPL